jgi:hypothetical protein
VYFNGGVYFQGPRVGDVRPELWRWDLGAAQGPPPVVAPKVDRVVVNDGSAQRSMVTSLTVHFDRPVRLQDGAVSLRDSAGRTYPVLLGPAGSTALTITFGGPGVVGGSLPDGRYTLTVKAGAVSDPGTGGVMPGDFTFAFTRLFGDLTGDGVYDRDARVMVRNSLGLHVGDAGYLAALDVNADGAIDAADERAVIRNWGKSV